MTKGARTWIIAVDLDGVIFRINLTRFHREGMDYFGALMPNAVTALRRIKNAGWKIIIYTCRLNPKINKGYTVTELREKVENVLRENNVPYDEVYTGIGKPIADFYVDDKAVRFENWHQVLGVLNIEK